MNILMVSYWDFQDEGMQVTQKTPLFFAEQGHRVTFLVHSETTSRPSLKTEIHPRVRVVRFDLPLKWMGRFHPLNRIRQLILFGVCCVVAASRFCREENRPDVIYAAEADAILIGSLLGRIFRVPLVTRFYGVSRITKDFDFRERTLRRRGVRHFFSRAAMARPAAMAIVTDDGSGGADILKAVNPRVPSVHYWANGVDRPAILDADPGSVRRGLGLAPEAFILLVVCRLDHWKGVDLALRALDRARGLGLTNALLLVAGAGPELESLVGLASKLRLADCVRFVGAVAHSDIYQYYRCADVFLSLYRYSNIGNPLREALNAGACIVTLDTAETGAVISDRVNGRLIPYEGNEDAAVGLVAEALVELQRDPGSRQELMAGARQYAKDKIWTWQERLKTELDAIEALVRERVPGRSSARKKRRP
jgi:glycosyltransferase involved in cell wall biosynthesis